MIDIRNLSKVYKKDRYEVHALKNVSLHISEGKIHGIIGLSGAGKSSLVRCINLLEVPTEGEVIVASESLTKLSPKALREKRQKIGMIFQNFNLLQSKTVFENIAFPLEIVGLDKISIKLRVEELLNLVGLSDKAHAYPANLSGGQKQRVGIARALANRPDVLLCDEATSALDPLTTTQILSLLKDINEKTGVTIVVITHEMDVIKAICHEVTLLEYGEVIESGDTIALFTSPKSQKTRSFFTPTEETDFKDIPGKKIRLIFDQNHAEQPILSHLMKEADLEINIIAGQIEKIGSATVGQLVVAISGTDAAIAAAISRIQSEEIKLEVLS